jgi:hypothetical protein
MMPLHAQGWLPLDFHFDPEPSLVTAASVRWMDFEADSLAEPFFWQTVEKLREASSSQLIDTSVDTFLRLASLLPSAGPAGFIFHISHCGSTLLANALRAAPQTLVAAEATPFVRLARWRKESPDAYLRGHWQSKLRRLYESLFTIYANHLGPATPHRLVVKFSSLNLFGLKFVRQSWPDIPCLILVRDPVDVLVSSVTENGWLAHKLEPGRPLELYGWSEPPQAFAEMSNEEYCARLLARHLTAALEGIDEHCKVVDYEDLTPSRIIELARFFGLELPRTENLDKVLTVYSKDPAKNVPFLDDRHRKRRLASKSLKDAAVEFALPHYIALRSRGGW